MGSWGLLGACVLLIFVGYSIQGIFRAQSDVVERSLSQVELLHAEMDQREHAVDELADGLEAAIFICDTRGTVIYANDRAIEMFRFPDPIGRSILAVTLSHEIEQQLFDCFREGQTLVEERFLTNPVDRVGICKVWLESDNKRAFVSIYEITDLRRLERIRQDFVSNVSHELRTPLTVIRAMAETLHDEPKPSKQLLSRYLGKIIEEVDRLSRISADLLTLSVAESNPVKKSTCDIALILRETLENLTDKAQEKGLELRYEGPSNLAIEANSTQMVQVAINLIDNAINYTPSGYVAVKVTQHGSAAELEVSDSGMGIGSEHLPRIFERFYRVDRGRSRATGGTGLGLSIVKHIVEAHGGHVTVESRLNAGSTFKVTLPMATEKGVASIA